MKNISVMLCCLSISIVYGQSYTINFVEGGDSQLVHIYLDMHFSPTDVWVEKEIVESSVGSLLDQNSTYFFGDFEFDDDSAELDYVTHNYFWIPFHPDSAFVYLDRIDPEIESGVLRFNDYVSEQVNGDIRIFCTCGGQALSASASGGCVAHLIDLGRGKTKGKCFRDTEQGCPNNDCIQETMVEPGMIAPSGGILVQVGSAQATLLHNFNSYK